MQQGDDPRAGIQKGSSALEQWSKRVAVVAHDFAATFCAFSLALILRGEPQPTLILGLQPHMAALAFSVFAIVIYHFCALYASRWRFASLFDLFGIFKAVCIVTAVLLLADYLLSPRFAEGSKIIGGRTLAIYWCVQIILLGGPRVVYRTYRSWRRRAHSNADPLAAVIVGRAADADPVISAVDSGLAGPLKVYGIISPLMHEVDEAVRGVPIWGTIADLEALLQNANERGITVQRAIIAPEAMQTGPLMEQVIGAFRRMGIPAITLDVTRPMETRKPARLHTVIDDDLLIRPLVTVDPDRLAANVVGKRVIVTGGGGSIGAELALRSAQVGAAAVLVLEHSEAALHAILDRAGLELPADRQTVSGRLCDIRDRERLARLTTEFAPDVVFHAAALKHVPHLEREVCDAVRTNIFGTVNAADAAVAAGAKAFVLISTYKATQPVSVLGATKRVAEMYIQALDATLASRDGRVGTTRLGAVRFGNVLGTAGSVVPRFRAQIEAGGPVTVTDPAMVRYFMTKREATDLLWTAAHLVSDGAPRAASTILVLNMGQPVRIDDLAKRMIRLAGYEPGEGIEVQYTGQRPGERLTEMLFEDREPKIDIGVQGIVAAEAMAPPMSRLKPLLARLEACAHEGDDEAARAVVAELVSDLKTPAKVVAFRPNGPAISDVAG